VPVLPTIRRPHQERSQRRNSAFRPARSPHESRLLRPCLIVINPFQKKVPATQSGPIISTGKWSSQRGTLDIAAGWTDHYPRDVTRIGSLRRRTKRAEATRRCSGWSDGRWHPPRSCSRQLRSRQGACGQAVVAGSQMTERTQCRIVGRGTGSQTTPGAFSPRFGRGCLRGRAHRPRLAQGNRGPERRARRRISS